MCMGLIAMHVLSYLILLQPREIALLFVPLHRLGPAAKKRWNGFSTVI